MDRRVGGRGCLYDFVSRRRIFLSYAASHYTVSIRLVALNCFDLTCSVSMIGLCPATGVIDEKCFQSQPLDFAGRSSLRWGGVGGEELFFNPTIVSEGTVPKGSQWARYPVPRGPWGWDRTGAVNPPVCQESPECLAYGRRLSKDACKKDPRSPRCAPIPRATANQTKGCRCSDDGAPSGPANLEVVDRLLIPNHTAPGKWLLGWRWDAEESNQVVRVSLRTIATTSM